MLYTFIFLHKIHSCQRKIKFYQKSGHPLFSYAMKQHVAVKNIFPYSIKKTKVSGPPKDAKK